MSATHLPAPVEMEQLFRQKYGDPETTGWGPRRRRRLGYFLPTDIYEATVARHVHTGCRWLDVGGGDAVFPDNVALARTLVSRCAHVTAVDPSPTVRRNTIVNDWFECMLEDFQPTERFDLVTMRMVAEHVEHPEAFGRALANVTAPGGTVIIFTVNRWSPVSIASALVPFKFHHAVKSVFWGGDEDATFPVHYKMNSSRALREALEPCGFTLTSFAPLDDLAVFHRFRVLGYAELLVRTALNRIGLRYPEQCLLAIFERDHDAVSDASPAGASAGSADRVTDQRERVAH